MLKLLLRLESALSATLPGAEGRLALIVVWLALAGGAVELRANSFPWLITGIESSVVASSPSTAPICAWLTVWVLETTAAVEIRASIVG